MNELSTLLKKIINSESSPEELDYFMSLLDSPEHSEVIQKLMESQIAEEVPSNEIPMELRQRLNLGLQIILTQPKERKIKPLRYKAIAIAASLLLVGTAMIFYFNSNLINQQKNFTTQIVNINPGGNKATLTLADGQSIVLSDNQNGIIIDSENIKYTDGSDLFVIQSDSEGSLSARQASTLVLTTPKGGQYQLTLSDGTKVWLNAASSLKYPSQFANNERLVELTGEAYFEVMPNKKQPFIVKSATQEIEVLGTHFNVMAYDDEVAVKTTLIEGSIRLFAIQPETRSNQLKNKVKSDIELNGSILLNPKEQSILSHNNKFEISKVDPSIAVAWKNGDFIFNNENLGSIMRKVARWYDVDIVYAKEVEDFYFSGIVSRSKDLSSVLEMLEFTEQIKFKIEGREVKVMK